MILLILEDILEGDGVGGDGWRRSYLTGGGRGELLVWRGCTD